MRRVDATPWRWRKSSYSGTQENCVEVAVTPHVVALRDSKDPHGPRVMVTRTAFARFLRQLR